MDNGILVFIILALGVVVVWQTSKLKQYERFERMLPDEQRGQALSQAGGSASSTATHAPAGTTGGVNPANAGGSGSSSGSGAVAADDTHAHAAERGTTGVGPDDNIEEAKRVQRVMAQCHYAAFYVEQLDDDYELAQFTGIVDECIATSRKISDPFLEATALQPLILLMNRAGWEERQQQLMARVRDDMVRVRIENALAEEAAEV